MPKMDGIELSGILMERYPNLKIVVVTGHDEFEYARQSVKLGISDFILKPIRASELLQVTAKLRAAIEQEIGREYEPDEAAGGDEAELALSQGEVCKSMVK